MAKNNYQNWTKEELIARIKTLEKRKKYGLVWEDKKEDVVEQCKKQLPILKEVKSKEIITDKDKPTNLLIEGDNYHALSVLNYTHAKKVDVIYIDPPYNTGNKDFIFNDRYVDSEDGYRHSKWLSFMEKRLKLVKDLLKDTGVIFISIDDNEMAQLKLLMDSPDLFGEKNFICDLLWKKKGTSTNVEGVQVSSLTEYILCYGKTPLAKLKPRTYKKEMRNYPFLDNLGRYRTTIIEKKNVGSYTRESMRFKILGENCNYKCNKK
ncbi:MAG: site-specific DNA-methyltransferase [Candidatus Omnitrophica bacterium]|nr:site-specific DNA-methyltransferase [Candidatus Omnitrophota bacterium]